MRARKKQRITGFELTDPAMEFIETSLKDIISTAKEAMVIAKKEMSTEWIPAPGKTCSSAHKFLNDINVFEYISLKRFY